jgi:Ca2+-binding EF-hand superfamily protein
LYKEVRYHLKLEQMKRDLVAQYDYTAKKAFQAIDDWNYGYIDYSNLKKFLRSAGVVCTKSEVMSILRRFDMDGDGKVNYKEF